MKIEWPKLLCLENLNRMVLIYVTARVFLVCVGRRHSGFVLLWLELQMCESNCHKATGRLHALLWNRHCGGPATLILGLDPFTNGKNNFPCITIKPIKPLIFLNVYENSKSHHKKFLLWKIISKILGGALWQFDSHICCT